MKLPFSLEKLIRLSALLVAFASAIPASATAYTINVNTASIANHPAGPFALSFQSLFGSGDPQTFTLSNFQLTGGGFIPGTEGAIGAVGGDVTSSLVLNPSDSSVYNEFYQQFDASVTGIRFTLDFTTNPSGPMPTSFSLALLDYVSLFPLPTDGFADTLLLLAIDENGKTQVATGTSTGDTAGVMVSVAVPDTAQTGLLFLLAVGGLGYVHAARRRLLA